MDLDPLQASTLMKSGKRPANMLWWSKRPLTPNTVYHIHQALCSASHGCI